MKKPRAPRRLGIDLDGVVSDFNAAYREAFVALTGEDKFNGEVEPPCWEYATHYGYTIEQDRAVWHYITHDGDFWRRLAPYPGADDFLWWLDTVADEVYFITTRPGLRVKEQSEEWLMAHGCDRPTVLIARGEKGMLATGLQLTHFLDDRPENCLSVAEQSGDTRVYLLEQRYNAWATSDPRYARITRVPNLDAFQQAVEEA